MSALDLRRNPTVVPVFVAVVVAAVLLREGRSCDDGPLTHLHAAYFTAESINYDAAIKSEPACAGINDVGDIIVVTKRTKDAFSKEFVAITGPDRVIHTYSTASGLPIGEIAVHPRLPLVAIGCRGAVRPSGDDSGFVEIWSLSEKKCIVSHKLRLANSRGIAWSPNGRLLVYVSDDTIWTCAIHELARVNALENVAQKPARSVADTLEGLSVSGDSNYAFVRDVGHPSEGAWLVDILCNKAVLKFAAGLERNVFYAFAPDGEHVVAADREGVVSFWSCRSGQRVATFPESGEVPYALYRSNSLLLDSREAESGIYSFRSPSDIVRRVASVGPPVAVSANGTAVLFGSRTEVRTWRVALLHDQERARRGEPVEVASTGGAEPSRDDLDRLWMELGSEDARGAHSAIYEWTDHGDDGIRYITSKVRQRLVGESVILHSVELLSSSDFQVRANAQRAIRAHGVFAVPVLQKALRQNLTAEQITRIRGAVAGFQSLPVADQEIVRLLRTIVVADRVKSKSACDYLRLLSSLGDNTVVGAQAVDVLGRWRLARQLD